MTAGLWYAAMGEVEALNEMVDDVTDLRVAGYGLEIADQKESRFMAALVGSTVGTYFTVCFFVIGWMNASRQSLKMFFTSTGSLLGLLFCGLWYKFLESDHIVSTSEKMELFGVSLFLGIGTLVFCWLGFRIRVVRSKSVSSDAQVSQENRLEPIAESSIPSVESLLTDEPSEGSTEGEEEAVTQESDSVEEPIPPVAETEKETEPPRLPSVSDEGIEEPVLAEDMSLPVEKKESGPPVQEPEEETTASTSPSDEPEPSAAETAEEPPSTVEESSSTSDVEPDTVAPPLPIQDMDESADLTEPPPLPPDESTDLAEPPPLPPEESADLAEPPPLPPEEEDVDKKESA